MTDATLTLRLIIRDPVPGVAYGRQDDTNQAQAVQIADDGPLRLDIQVTLKSDGRLTGPFVRREGKERRFVYIAIGQSVGQCTSVWTRRAKVDIHTIPTDLRTAGAVLQVELPGKARDGGPACATVRPLIGWHRV